MLCLTHSKRALNKHCDEGYPTHSYTHTNAHTHTTHVYTHARMHVHI